MYGWRLAQPTQREPNTLIFQNLAVLFVLPLILTVIIKLNINRIFQELFKENLGHFLRPHFEVSLIENNLKNIGYLKKHRFYF